MLWKIVTTMSLISSRSKDQMNHISTRPAGPARAGQKATRRAAFAQPRFLMKFLMLSLMMAALGGSSWWAMAQRGGGGRAPLSLRDLPNLMVE
jgi:hypothetical protein